MINTTSVPLKQFIFSLNPGLKIQNITQAENRLNFDRNLHLITIIPGKDLQPGKTDSIIIEYSGTPSASVGAFNFDTRNSEDLIWTFSEPFGARSWWPCKDIPADKPDSVDIRVTVPSGLIVASNGLASLSIVAAVYRSTIACAPRTRRSSRQATCAWPPSSPTWQMPSRPMRRHPK